MKVLKKSNVPYIHEKIRVLCVNCISMPCCLECIAGAEHLGHAIIYFKSKKDLSLIETNFKGGVYQRIVKRVENEIDLQYKENNVLKKKEFKKIHDIVSNVEIDIERQLKTIYEENTLINTTITSSTTHDNGILKTIANNNQDNIEMDEYQKSLLILNNNNIIDNDKKVKKFKNQILNFNNTLIKNTLENLKLIYSFDDKNNNNNNNNNNDEFEDFL
ncbi:hypothetical protein ACTFIY_007708 [Dictyostelium cf. discoideum]